MTYPNHASFRLLSQKRLLWIHKEVDLTPHAGVGLVLHAEDAEKYHVPFENDQHLCLNKDTPTHISSESCVPNKWYNDVRSENNQLVRLNELFQHAALVFLVEL